MSSCFGNTTSREVNNDKDISPFSRKCLDSFKDYLTDYEIRYWTVDDIAKIDDDMAVEISKIDSYALKKIFLEIYVIFQYGGIYIDQNLELIAPIDDLLEESNSFLGLDERHHISSSIWYEKNAKSYLATKVYENVRKENETSNNNEDTQDKKDDVKDADYEEK